MQWDIYRHELDYGLLELMPKWIKVRPCYGVAPSMAFGLSLCHQRSLCETRKAQ
jgi:hypothetical protein